MSTLRRTAAAAVLAVGLLPAAAGAAPLARSLTVKGIVGPIAMDGSIVAAGYLSPRCDHVLAWNVRTGVRVELAGNTTCSLDLASTSTTAVSEVAVAGRRVAWITTAGVSDIWAHAFTATLDARVETDLGTAVLTHDGDIGSVFSGLVGDGSILRYGSWTRRYQDLAGCPPEEACPVVVENPVLRGVSGLPLPLPFAGANWVVPQAADSGRILARVGDGRLALLDARGAVKTLIPPARPPSGEAGLRRDRLAFLTDQGTLDVYSAIDGGLVHSWPVVRGARGGVDLFYGYAAYRTQAELHLLKLSTGRDVVVAPGASFELDAPGLVYVTHAGTNNKTARSTLHLVPFERLRELNR